MNSAVLMEHVCNDVLCVVARPTPWVQFSESDKLVVHQVHNDSIDRFLRTEISSET